MARLRQAEYPSKFQAQHQLRLARGFIERRNGGEARLPALPAVERHSEIRLIDERLRVVQIGVIEEVEHIGPKSQAARFSQPAQRKRAAQRDIHVIESRSGERVASRIALAAGGGLR